VHLDKLGAQTAGRDAELYPAGKPTFSFELAAIVFSLCAPTEHGSLDASWQWSGLPSNASLKPPKSA
jgi:hypothetical protein